MAQTLATAESCFVRQLNCATAITAQMCLKKAPPPRGQMQVGVGGGFENSPQQKGDQIGSQMEPRTPRSSWGAASLLTLQFRVAGLRTHPR
jgi:hypothetical protein